MDPNHAILFAQLVGAAYDVPKDVLTNNGGHPLNGTYGADKVSYSIMTSLYGSDLANDLNDFRGQQIVTYGYVLRDNFGNVVISIRGTEGVYEWLHDFYFLYTPFPPVPGGGNTDDGFTTIYESLRIGPDQNSQSLINYLIEQHAARPFVSLTICGHSLGAALATLLALEVGVAAAKTGSLPTPVVYTYASPRVGDFLFAALYNHVVPVNYRIANVADIVPKVPPAPLYEHVAGTVELNPSGSPNPSTTLINFSIPCEHILSSYLFLLSRLPGVDPMLKSEFPLDQACDPTAARAIPFLGAISPNYRGPLAAQAPPPSGPGGPPGQQLPQHSPR